MGQINDTHRRPPCLLRAQPSFSSELPSYLRDEQPPSSPVAGKRSAAAHATREAPPPIHHTQNKAARRSAARTRSAAIPEALRVTIELGLSGPNAMAMDKELRMGASLF